MTRVRSILHWSLPLLVVLAGLIGTVPLVMGQVGEVEPNQPCEQAQNLGQLSSSFVLEGSLDSQLNDPYPGPYPEPGEEWDVDFFQVSATPGLWIQIDLEGQSTEKGTLADPLLGVFNTDCVLMYSDDDGGEGYNSRLLLQMPADGRFVIGVTIFRDWSWQGGGIGSYQLGLTKVDGIASISGRLVDAVTGAALPGNAQPWAFAELYRCDVLENCYHYVNGQNVDGSGRFQFVQTQYAQPLPPGYYRVVGRAEQYTASSSEVFEVQAGQALDLGDIRVQSYPARIELLETCASIPANGGLCRYSFRVTNGSATLLDGAVWSNVVGLTNSFSGYTEFQVAPPRPLRLNAGKSQVIQFSLPVPSGVQPGAFFCTNAYVSDDPAVLLYNTVGTRDLFCFTKTAEAGFTRVTDAKLLRYLQRVTQTAAR